MRKSAQSKYLLLANIGRLLTLRGAGAPRRGPALKDVGLIDDAAVLCGGGKIIAAGPQRELLRDPWLRKNRRRVRELDCRRGVVLPGFVDSHTHPVFAGPRLVDFEHRIAGAGYEQIAQAGGGIRSSVAGVRSASRSQLAEHALAAFNAMLRHGTTTVEAKSGYGLSLEAEIKSLEALRDAARHFPGTVVSTLLAAHVVPQEFEGRADEYVKQVCEVMVPAAAKRKLARFVDVFCERGAFSLDHAQSLFAAAARHGLRSRAHVCQFSPSKLEGLLQHNPASLDHMDYLADDDLSRLARSGTVATLVPGANYFLGHTRYPDARRLIDSGAAVALATDFNPGTSPTPSMPFVLSLACTHMKMHPAEAISAATINSAAALELQHLKGSIEPGKDADLAVFDVPDYREIPYWTAWNRCAATIVAGESAWSCV